MNDMNAANVVILQHPWNPSPQAAFSLVGECEADSNLRFTKLSTDYKGLANLTHIFTSHISRSRKAIRRN